MVVVSLLQLMMNESKENLQANIRVEDLNKSIII